LHQVKLRAGVGKWLLRQAARDRLPAECTAPGKRGFTVPVSTGSAGSSTPRCGMRCSPPTRWRGTRFGEKAVRRLLDDHLHARATARGAVSLWVLERGGTIRSARGGAARPRSRPRTKGREWGLEGATSSASPTMGRATAVQMHAMKILGGEPRALGDSIGQPQAHRLRARRERILKKLSGRCRAFRSATPTLGDDAPRASPSTAAAGGARRTGAPQGPVQSAMQQPASRT